MHEASTINTIGHYCGRFGPGFWGEPLNSLSNIAFLLGALFAWHAWHQRGSAGRWPPFLFVLTAAVGLGSFIFHSWPLAETRMADLVPIQVLGLAFLGYLLSRYLRLSPLQTIALLFAFFLLRQIWIVATPRGLLGGGGTHIPTLLLLTVLAMLLYRRGLPLWRYMAAAIGSYTTALLVRSWDLHLCADYPWGLHWAWHLLTAMAATLLVYGIAVAPPAPLAEGPAR